MKLDRLWLHGAPGRWWRRFQEEVVHAPLEPILHPSSFRLALIGLFTLLGHLMFGIIWSVWLPQPYENVAMRALMGSLAVVYLVPAVRRDPSSPASAWLFGMATWLQLPWYFWWMYWMNDGNAVWLASTAAMILIYFHATDWRLATLGTLSGGLLGWVTAQLMLAGPAGWHMPHEHLVTLAFAFFMGLMLGFSSANLRRTRLLNTLSTMGVMAHELRTPLATIDLMGDVLRTLAQHDLPEPKQRKLNDLANRLHQLVRTMHRQIDTQISNAQLQRLPHEQTPIMAAALVQEAVAHYPYRSGRERDCVQVVIQQDFCFRGSPQLFAQVLNNLIKNALHSLVASTKVIEAGDLRLTVGVHHGKGRIAVADEGLGMGPEQLSRIFEPFYSTQAGAGSGLGLSFCRNVVEAVRGTIKVHSESGRGAVFMIDLPLDSGDHPA
ncbi:MAG: two-component system, autoinducer sensor kinase/phosphatase CqsS [Betaproteobacteria bacterium]|nr:two-component system, autoinducer sensor kinase/phosphatase CqsS [Betaproteobacteria bacterium]